MGEGRRERRVETFVEVREERSIRMSQVMLGRMEGRGREDRGRGEGKGRGGR